MLLLMKTSATAADIDAAVRRVSELGFDAHVMPGEHSTAVGITGNTGPIPEERFVSLKGLLRAVPITEPYKLVSRGMRPNGTVIDFETCQIGGPEVVVMAGPCSVEDKDQIFETAVAAKKAGAHFLRGGAFKPRTSPYSFQGLKEEGLKLLAEARDKTGLKIITEVKDTETLPMVADYTDILQIGARNMHNYSLLEAVGKSSKAVLLKRGLSATIKEFLMAAEYIVSNGNHNVMLCERGIRTFETMTRNTFDVGAIAVLKRLSHLPVVGDPSHGIGIAEDVPAMARAAVAAGADSILIEVHPNPAMAWSDGHQSLNFDQFKKTMDEINAVARVVRGA